MVLEVILVFLGVILVVLLVVVAEGEVCFGARLYDAVQEMPV